MGKGCVFNVLFLVFVGIFYFIGEIIIILRLIELLFDFILYFIVIMVNFIYDL